VPSWLTRQFARRPGLRLAQIIALALCITAGLAFAVANLFSWELEDAEAYWNAALRLRQGADLYVPVTADDEVLAYRYAPWLAWVWVPLTYLPKPLVQVAWSVALLSAVIIALAPLARARTTAAICLLFLLGGILVRTASTGNVHAVMVAALVWGVPRRSGPVWIAAAASLKIVPVLYALVFLGRREWLRFVTTFVLTGVLWLPVLLYDLDEYPAEAGVSLSLLSIVGPVWWGLIAAAVALVAVGLARTRYAWLAASTAVIAAIPRLLLYDLTYLLVWQDRGSPKRTRRADQGADLSLR